MDIVDSTLNDRRIGSLCLEMYRDIEGYVQRIRNAGNDQYALIWLSLDAQRNLVSRRILPR